jgi:hypothetical protein
MTTLEEITPDKLIQHGEAISRLLNDTTIQKVLSDLDARYYVQWKAAETPEVREGLWAMVRALGDLKRVLEGTVQAGLHAQAMKARRDKEEQQT